LFEDDKFDYVSFFGSIMSFKLAGTQDSYLAYSIFESLADFSINIINQIKVNLKLKNNITFLGNMFENSIVLSRVLSKLGANKPYLSNIIAFDE